MTTNKTSKRNTWQSGRGGNDALTLAVRLVDSQLSNGIGLAEAVQFAARYHNVTCSAIQVELSKTGGKFLGQIV